MWKIYSLGYRAVSRNLYKALIQPTVDSRLPDRSSLRSIFFGPNSFSVKAISKAFNNAVRPPFRTTVNFLWQNGKFTLVIAVKWYVFNISLWLFCFEKGFLYWKKIDRNDDLTALLICPEGESLLYYRIFSPSIYMVTFYQIQIKYIQRIQRNLTRYALHYPTIN